MQEFGASWLCIYEEQTWKTNFNEQLNYRGHFCGEKKSLSVKDLLQIYRQTLEWYICFVHHT